MNVTINPLSDIEQEAIFEVESDELQPHFNRAYEKFRPKAELRGFRKGKVPLGIIRQVYGDAIEHDALDGIANELYRTAMEERNIHPIGTPSMVEMDFKRAQHFRFTIKYEVKPDIALGQYTRLDVEKPVHNVSDHEVDAEIHHLRRLNSTPIDAQRVTDEEHIVTADTQELDDAGTPLIGKKSSASRFYLADEALAPEIKAALAAAEVGGIYRATVTTGHDDHSHTHHFQFTVTAAQKVDLPPFDEDLVRKVTGGTPSSPEEFRANIRADLERYWDDQGNARVNDGLANEIVRRHEFAVPESLVTAFLDSFVEDLRSRSRDQKLPASFNDATFRAENRAQAIWQAKWLLLKERIAEKEQITVAEEDLVALAERDAPRLNVDPARLLEYYRSTSSASERILSEKVLTFLRAHASISERPVTQKTH